MSSRVQQALDGELSVHELNPAETADLKKLQATITGVLDTLPDPRIDTWSAVRRRLTETPAAPGRAGVLEWLLQPRPLAIHWRPAYGLAAALLLIATLIVPRIRRTDPTVPAATAQQVFVQFRLEAPAANQVSLAGDFTEWKPAYSLRRSNSGVWTVVVPLDPGIHDYAFVVDGQRWVPDPLAPAVSDGFGGMNSRLAILTPDAR
jgi:hypothetical protein